MVRAINVQYQQIIVEIHRELAREVDLRSNVKVEYDLDRDWCVIMVVTKNNINK